MNKKMIRNIVIVAGVILLLVIGIVVLQHVNTSDETPVASQAPQYTVYSIETEDVQSVSTQSGGAPLITVTRDGDRWALNGDAEDVDQSKLASFVSTAAKVTSEHEIELNAQDLSQYGLEQPEVNSELTVIVTAKDGSVQTLYIGDRSATLGEYFIRTQNSRDVYTINSYKADTLAKPISYYYQFNRFSANTADIINIVLERRGADPIELRLKNNIDNQRYNTVWEIAQPYPEVYNAIDDAVDDMILTPLSELTIIERAPEGAAYGFDKPSAVMTITSAAYRTDGTREAPQTIRMAVGNSENGKTYVQLDGRAYVVPSASVAFVSTDAFLLVSKLAGLVDVLDTDALTVQSNGTEMKVDISHADGEQSFRVNDKAVDTENFRTVYQEIIGWQADAVYQGEPMGDVRMSFKYHGYNGTKDVVITISSINEVYDAVTRDGITRFLVKKSKIDALMKTISDYVNSL